jgi:6-phosphofructokinase 1
MQQGGSPSPFDRNLGTKMGAKAANWLVDTLMAGGDYSKPDSATLVGLRGRNYFFSEIQTLKGETDFK